MTYNIYYSVYKVDYRGAAAPKKTTTGKPKFFSQSFNSKDFFIYD